MSDAGFPEDHAAAENLILELVQDGLVEFDRVGEDGEFRFRLTEAGERRAEQLVAGLDPED